MNVIKTNLNNFLVAENIINSIKDYNDDFVLSHNNVLQYAKDVFCPACNEKMVMNGSNRYGKDKIAKINTQRYRCPICKTNLEMSNEIIKGLISEFMKAINHMILSMRMGYLSFENISETLSPFIQLSPDTVRNIHQRTVDGAEINIESDLEIFHYDEQHPKKGRTQKYRLSLLDGKSRQIIVEELATELNSSVVRDFLDRHLPKNKIIFIITDHLRMYNDILDEIRPGCILHQHCLLHLNKNIVKDFHRNCSLKDELIKYELLNIFYDRTEEIEYLNLAVKREQRFLFRHEKGYNRWLLDQRKDFHDFVRSIEKKRRRNCKRMKIPDRMKMWSMKEARSNLDRLKVRLNEFSITVRKRIMMIENDWDRLTAFYHFDSAPATNNPIENYYSCSCKQVKKKQHRRNTGLLRQWKLYAMKRAGMLEYAGPSMIEIIGSLIPFRLLT
jgi:transposase-like protein